MRMFMTLIILVSIFTLSYGIVCTPGICEGACNTSPTLESCKKLNKEYRPNSTFCGCCATCVDYIPIGGECGEQQIILPLLGIPPPIEKHCIEGSSCKNHICVKETKI